VFDGTNSLLYIDGSLVATTSNLPNQLAPASAWLGTTDGNSDMYAGDLDDLRIYRIARTPAEIEADMHGTSGPSEPGLVAYLDFDERCGTIVPDLSPMGNDASLGEGDPARMPTLIESSVPPDE
jgi:hypothetical protein